MQTCANKDKCSLERSSRCGAVRRGVGNALRCGALRGGALLRGGGVARRGAVRRRSPWHQKQTSFLDLLVVRIVVDWTCNGMYCGLLWAAFGCVELPRVACGCVGLRWVTFGCFGLPCVALGCFWLRWVALVSCRLLWVGIAARRGSTPRLLSTEAARECACFRFALKKWRQFCVRKMVSILGASRRHT